MNAGQKQYCDTTRQANQKRLELCIQQNEKQNKHNSICLQNHINVGCVRYILESAPQFQKIRAKLKTASRDHITKLMMRVHPPL